MKREKKLKYGSTMENSENWNCFIALTSVACFVRCYELFCLYSYFHFNLYAGWENFIGGICYLCDTIFYEFGILVHYTETYKIFIYFFDSLQVKNGVFVLLYMRGTLN